MLKAIINMGAKASRRASITVEAALSLSLFLFAVLVMLTPMVSLRQQLRASVILEEQARLLAKWKYAEYAGRQEGTEKLDETVLSQAEKGLSIAALTPKLTAPDIRGVDLLTQSHITEEEIRFVLNYEVKSPFAMLYRSGLRKQVVASRRAWIGAEPYRFLKDGTEAEDEPLVYIGSRSTDVYHTDRNCSYLVSTYLSGTAAGMSAQRNRFGERYSPCQACKPGIAAGMVFYTEAGKRYHSSASCPAMQSHPHTETLKQAQEAGRHRCHRCPAI